jgi:hypothetical protein
MTYTQSLQRLCQRGTDLDAVDRHGTTLLIKAARDDDTETIQILLDHGANINLFDRDNSTALAEACYQLHIKSVQLLLQHGACLQPSGPFGENLLFVVVDLDWKGQDVSVVLKIMEMLIEHGEDVQSLDESKNTLRDRVLLHLSDAQSIHPCTPETCFYEYILRFLNLIEQEICDQDLRWSDSYIAECEYDLKRSVRTNDEESHRMDRIHSLSPEVMEIILGHANTRDISNKSYDALRALRAKGVHFSPDIHSASSDSVFRKILRMPSQCTISSAF